MTLAFQLSAADVGSVRANIVELCAGTSFVVVGLLSFGIALVRRRMGMRIFLWLGLWSILYGSNAMWSPLDGILPPWLHTAEPYLRTLNTYMVLPFASLSWMEATRGWMRRFSAGLVVLELIVAAIAFISFLSTGNPDRLLLENNLIAAFACVVLLAVVCSKKLFAKYSAFPSQRFFAIGAFVFTLEALYTNIANPLGIRTPPIVGHLGFAVLLISFGHAGLEMVLRNERRLLSIESELEVARQIQAKILPREAPRVSGLNISARYRPMTAVAGDFYEFVAAEDHHLGVLIADVCGHGVPAALIASMLKTAVQAAAGSAARPGEFLRRLNQFLFAPLQGQLVSAAYLWLDMKEGKALYAAAGHPPLLHVCHGELLRVENNGLLMGVLPDAEYPVTEILLHKGDRLLLYTDGITDAENASGVSFAEAQLSAHAIGPDPAEHIFRTLPAWQSSDQAQDDMTLIVLDITADAFPHEPVAPAYSGVHPNSDESYSPVPGN